MNVPPLIKGFEAFGAWWCEYCFAVLLCGGLEME